MDTRFVPGLILVGFVAALAFITLLAIGLSRPGTGRAGLVAGGLPLSLLAPAVATAYASREYIGLFAGIADSGSGAARALLDAFAALWWLQRVAWGAFAVSCLLGLVLSLWRIGSSPDDLPCSMRRGLVLCLLPTLGLLVASALTHQLGKALRVSAAVISSDANDPVATRRVDAVLEAEGLQTKGAGSIAATSGFIARAATVGFVGGFTAVLVLLGLALPGFILAWRVRFEASFSAIAAAVWLLAALGAGVVSLGVLDPLRLP